MASSADRRCLSSAKWVREIMTLLSVITVGGDSRCRQLVRRNRAVSGGDELVLTPLQIGVTTYRATQSCLSRAAIDVAAGGIAAAIVIRRTRISTYDGSAHRG